MDGSSRKILDPVGNICGACFGRKCRHFDGEIVTFNTENVSVGNFLLCRRVGKFSSFTKKTIMYSRKVSPNRKELPQHTISHWSKGFSFESSVGITYSRSRPCGRAGTVTAAPHALSSVLWRRAVSSRRVSKSEGLTGRNKGASSPMIIT